MPFSKIDLQYLKKENYDKMFMDWIKKATLIEDLSLVKQQEFHTDVKIIYRDFPHFQRMANYCGLMEDEKAGIPRTAYYGVVTFYQNNNRVFLVPANFPIS